MSAMSPAPPTRPNHHICKTPHAVPIKTSDTPPTSSWDRSEYIARIWIHGKESKENHNEPAKIGIDIVRKRRETAVLRGPYLEIARTTLVYRSGGCGIQTRICREQRVVDCDEVSSHFDFMIPARGNFSMLRGAMHSGGGPPRRPTRPFPLAYRVRRCFRARGRLGRTIY